MSCQSIQELKSLFFSNRYYGYVGIASDFGGVAASKHFVDAANVSGSERWKEYFHVSVLCQSGYSVLVVNEVTLFFYKNMPLLLLTDCAKH